MLPCPQENPKSISVCSSLFSFEVFSWATVRAGHLESKQDEQETAKVFLTQWGFSFLRSEHGARQTCRAITRQDISKRGFSKLLGVLGLPAFVLLQAGCAFDVVHVKQKPVTFSAATDSATFLLSTELKARLGTGFPTVLTANTTWTQVGMTEFGKVFATKDQIVKVEASNIYEAQIVVADSSLVGFYLPVEKTFAPLSTPIQMEIKTRP